MKPSEVAAHLMDPNLHADITFPEPRKAVKVAAEFMFDLADITDAARRVLESQDNVALAILKSAVEQIDARAAA